MPSLDVVVPNQITTKGELTQPHEGCWITFEFVKKFVDSFLQGEVGRRARGEEGASE